MSKLTTFISESRGIIGAGAFIGVFAAILQKLGNPGNMGICVACMERDISGALGLHRAAAVQYLRPEIIGIVLGSVLAAFAFREFSPRSGSSPFLRFFLGFFAMAGALVFLGCPWRTFLRIAGGDWNGLVGLAGLTAGIWAGVLFLRSGFTLGRYSPEKKTAGWILPAAAAGLLLLLLFAPLLGRTAEGTATGPVFFSEKGPGSLHAPLALSLLAGLGVGFLAQRTRFCTVGGIRNLIMVKDARLLSGVLALLTAAFLSNLALGQFRPGFFNQPIAHTAHLWNFAGMLLAGLCFTLAGGCPGRQLVLAGEGDGDAAVFASGMMGGAAFAHNFSFASSPAGPGPYGSAAVLVGLLFCLAVGLGMRERI